MSGAGAALQVRAFDVTAGRVVTAGGAAEPYIRRGAGSE